MPIRRPRHGCRTACKEGLDPHEEDATVGLRKSVIILFGASVYTSTLLQPICASLFTLMGHGMYAADAYCLIALCSILNLFYLFN